MSARLSKTSIRLLPSIPILALSLSPATAHLCIIRQGLESRGAIEAGDHHGEAVAAGDFNGDGYDDLAMGAPYEDISGGFADAGAVVVNWGTEFGVTHEGSLLLTEAALGGSSESYAEFGRALAAGDFNADGYDDLAVGVPGSSVGLGSNHIGKVYVLRGTAASGLLPWYILDQGDGGGANEAGDRFGQSLAVGNFDGDSGPAHSDLAVGAPGEDVNAGAIFFFMSNAAGPIGPSGWFKQTTLENTSNAGDMFGFSMAAGDLLGDAADDLAVGAPNKDFAGIDDGGLVYILPADEGVGFLGYAQWYDAGHIDARDSNTYFGHSVAVGRFMDPTGWESLAVGEPGRNVADYPAAGRVAVIPSAGLVMFPDDAVSIYEYNVGGFGEDNRFGHTVAGGFFDSPDGYEDLAVGSPYIKVGSYFSSGAVHVLFGGPDGPSPALYGYAGFNQGTLNDPVEGAELLGWSVAYGDFDGTGKGSLAAGAPGEDSQAGMVHVIAPWRQVYELQCRHSVAADCDGNLVFSQKPFDEVWIASTTKIMTVLLACERIQAGDFDLADEFDIPNWVVSEVPGSQVPLLYGERMSLENLMITCLMLSGNDAAYAIGDIMYGQLGPDLGVIQFVAEMNDRAAELGMAGTHFHNPAGLDKEVVGIQIGEHISTPLDMIKLGRAAMANSLFRAIVTTTGLMIAREGEVFGQPWEMDWSGSSFFEWIIDSPWFPEGSGVKGGWTPNAQSTGVFSADEFGTAVAGTFYTPKGAPEGSYGGNALDVLKLGLAECGLAVEYEYIADYFEFVMTGIKTVIGEITGGGSQTFGKRFDPAIIEICQTTGEAPTSAELEITHISEVLLGEGSGAEYGIEPFEAHGDIQFINMGDEQIQFQVDSPASEDPFYFTLDPGDIGVLPAYGGPDAFGYTMNIVNQGGTLMHLSVEEVYLFDLEFPPGPCVDSRFQARIYRDDDLFGDSFGLTVTGTDPVAGRELEARVIGYDPASAGVEDGEVPDLGGDLRLLAARPAQPNPFQSGTRIGFNLKVAGDVQVAVYDASGREVRTFPERTLVPGAWGIPWNGADDRGLPVADGVYFYQIRLDGKEAAQGRLVKIQ